MSEKIPCRNVVKIKFDGKPKDAKVDVVGQEIPTSPKEEAALIPKLPPLHPSVSEENLRWRHIDTSDTVINSGAPVAPGSPLRSSTSRPPRAKQLQSVKLLVDQHNKHISCSECQFMFLIDAEWLNAWYRCVISNDTSLYPGPINNWNLVATHAQDSTLANGTSSTSSLTLPVITPAVTAMFNRASALRGLSFDGVECDFAEELEQYQEKHAKSPLKDALASISANINSTGDEQASAVDYDYQTCQFAIKRELREDLDFYLLPLEAWQALHGWYGGGPPLPRALTHSLQYRASVPCAVGELLLQQHPAVHRTAPEDQEDGGNVRCDGFAEGAAMHDQDLHPPTDLLPCMQDTLRPVPQTPTGGYSLLHSGGGGGGLHRSFSSMNSLNHSLSTMSFPSMNDLQSVSDVASVSAPNTAAPIVAQNDEGGNNASTDEVKSEIGDNNGSTNTSNNTSAKNTTNEDSAGPSSAVSGKIAAKSSAFCHVCQRRAVTRCSKCSSIYYCGRDCQTLHWRFHKTLCPKLSKRKQLLEEASKASTAAAADTDTVAPSPAPSPSSAVIAVPVVHDRAGKVGLANLGNSCYMNSSLQCLSHIKPLTLAFLSHRVFKDLNSASRDGSGGKLAEQYGKLLEDLWFECTRRSVSPHQLKATLGRINSEYAGLAQQDAHELIELLLDKLHEDLNRVLKKPYTEKVEWDGVSSERTVAEASWYTHGLRENSVVRDLMGSLMRYQLTCPDCGKVSLSFEYHTTLQVAIPRRNTITKRVVFIPQLSKLTDLDPLLKKSPNTSTLQALLQYTAPESYEIVVDRLSTVRTLREAILKKIPPVHLQGSGGEVLLVESAFPVYAAVTRMLRDNQPVGKLTEEAVIYAYCPPAACPHHVFLFQRVFDPILETEAGTPDDGSPTTTASTSATAPPLDWKSLLRTSQVGLPILLSYDSKWTCSRLRYQVLMNTVRLFKSDSEFMRAAERVFANGARGLLEQFALSDTLDLRLVDAQGTSMQTACAAPVIAAAPTVLPGHSSLAGQLKDIWQGAAAVNAAPAAALQQTWTAACASLDGTQQQSASNVELLFGSQLFTDRTVKIEDFGGVTSYQSPEQNGIMFLSLDLLSCQRTGFDDSAIRKLYPAAASTSTAAGGTTATATASAGSGKGGFTLYQCLQEHTKEEVLDAGNEVYCSACKEHKAARKVVRFCRAHLPQVLVLSLKRFEFRDVSGLTGFQGSAHREKIDTFIDFPIDGLDLTPFCQPEDQPATGADAGTPSNSNSNNSPVYDLFAVCNHYGRMGFGHYTAAARDWEGAGLSSKWFAYDDNDVTGPCTPEEEEAEVHSRNAYILFYRQRGSPATID